MPVRQSLQMHCQAPTPSSVAIDPRLKGIGALNAQPTSLLAGRSSQKASPVASGSSRKGLDSLPPSPMKSISFGRIPIFGPNDMPNPFEGSSIMLLVQRQKPTLSPEDAASLEDGNWPAWFEKVRETLKSLLLSSLGDEWDDIMWFWMLVEGRQRFVTSQTSISPQSASELHLAEVGSWQKQKWGVDYVPELGQKDLKSWETCGGHGGRRFNQSGEASWGWKDVWNLIIRSVMENGATCGIQGRTD